MSPVEYNLAALASISGAMERPKSSGLSGSSSSVGGAGTGAFTLADLISNVGGDHEGEAEVRWSEDQSEVHHGQQGLALSNLANNASTFVANEQTFIGADEPQEDVERQKHP